MNGRSALGAALTYGSIACRLYKEIFGTITQTSTPSAGFSAVTGKGKITGPADETEILAPEVVSPTIVADLGDILTQRLHKFNTD